MVPKTGPHSGSQKVRFCYYLLHLSKVGRLKNGPHFGSCLKISFAQNTKKWGSEGYPKIGAEKRSPSAKMTVYLRIQTPWQRPLRARFLNKKQQFEQQQQQQQQQLQQLWLNVDFCFQNCTFWDETAKKGCCSLLESKGGWSDTPWAKARRIINFTISHRAFQPDGNFE